MKRILSTIWAAFVALWMPGLYEDCGVIVGRMED